MEFFPPVIFEVKAKAADAIAQFGVINKELDMMSAKATTSQKALLGMGVGFKYLRTAVLGLAGAYGVLAVSGLNEIKQEEAALANLKIATENAGVAFGQAKPYFDQAAQSMIALGFADEEAYAAMAKMTTATNSPKIALEQLATAADLARYSNISLSEAGTAIAKASVGSTRAFMELGLKMGVTIPKTATFAQMMQLVKDKVDGAAVAFGGTLAGKMAIADANFAEFKQQIGEQVLPVVIDFFDYMSKTGIPKLREFGDWIKRNGDTIKNFGLAVAGFWAGTKIAAGIMAVIKVVNLLRDAYIAAGIAAAFATGGTSVAAAVSALAIVGGTALATKLMADIIRGDKETPTGPSIPAGAYSGPAVGTYGPVPNLAGKGQKRVPTPTPKPTGSAKPAVVQNVTVYASNTNDISKKLSKAAKNGVPIGGK